MYHPTFNSYDDEIKEKCKDKETTEKEKEKEKEKDQCLICWDEKNVYKMQSFVLVTNTCKCDSLFHGSCLFNWVYQTQSCPICRQPSQFNVKLLKFFLQNKNSIIEQPINQNINQGINPGSMHALFVIYKVSLRLLQFIAYMILYFFIYGLSLSIRREMIAQD
jgi:hypothetical protein